MLRLTVFACAAVYAALVIFSADPQGPEGNEGPGLSLAGPVTDAPQPEPAVFVTADGRSLPVAAVIVPQEFRAPTGQVALVSTPRAAERVTASASQGQAQVQVPVAEVTGNSVNLRAGPSTADAVLTALLQGERVELLGATDTGWAQIRTISTGVEGFMATRFLNPLN